jgi:BolA family transcriptional regulator, general stress-responsive regulator
MGQVRETIEAKLRAALAPLQLSVTDETNKHHGHAGWRESGETHFHVAVTSATFTGKSRVERQRMVHHILAVELAGPVHALALSLRAPEEG